MKTFVTLFYIRVFVLFMSSEVHHVSNFSFKVTLVLEHVLNNVNIEKNAILQTVLQVFMRFCSFLKTADVSFILCESFYMNSFAFMPV